MRLEMDTFYGKIHWLRPEGDRVYKFPAGEARIILKATCDALEKFPHLKTEHIARSVGEMDAEDDFEMQLLLLMDILRELPLDTRDIFLEAVVIAARSHLAENLNQ